MKKNKNLYYWLGGLAALALVIGVVVYSQGNQLQGMLSVRPGGQACTYTYSEWGRCSLSTLGIQGGTQTRKVLSATPLLCTGTPVTTQSCKPAPAPTPVACTARVCTTWGDCVNGTQNCVTAHALPQGCTGAESLPPLTQTCTVTPTQPAPQTTPLTLKISGKVTLVNDISNALGSQVTVGSTISGTYTYLPSTVDYNTADSTVGDYFHKTSEYGMNLSVGGLTFMTDSANVDYLYETVNRPGDDDLVMHSYKNLPALNMPVNIISWQLSDNSGTTLSSDALPQGCPDLTKWNYINQLDVTGGTQISPTNPTPIDYLIRAKIDSCSV